MDWQVAKEVRLDANNAVYTTRRASNGAATQTITDNYNHAVKVSGTYNPADLKAAVDVRYEGARLVNVVAKDGFVVDKNGTIWNSWDLAIGASQNATNLGVTAYEIVTMEEACEFNTVDFNTTEDGKTVYFRFQTFGGAANSAKYYDTSKYYDKTGTAYDGFVAWTAEYYEIEKRAAAMKTGWVYIGSEYKQERWDNTTEDLITTPKYTNAVRYTFTPVDGVCYNGNPAGAVNALIGGASVTVEPNGVKDSHTNRYFKKVYEEDAISFANHSKFKVKVDSATGRYFYVK